jgi:hypothetical protein
MEIIAAGSYGFPFPHLLSAVIAIVSKTIKTSKKFFGNQV